MYSIYFQRNIFNISNILIQKIKKEKKLSKNKIKKEKINESEIKTISQQKIIQRGAKFFKKRLAIMVNLIFGRRVKNYNGMQFQF